MIVAGSASPLLLSSGGYNLTNSLRFRSSASAYLNRTQGTSTNQSIGTWSFWFKRGTLGTNQRLFEGHTATSDTGSGNIEFSAADSLVVGGWLTNWRITTQVFRDPSAWYHAVVTIDTTQATANNRIKVYINGTEVTAFSTTNNPTQNSTFGLNNNSSVLQIGRRRNVSNNDLFFDGYMTEVNFIDGQALTPSSFGQTNPATGVWQPIKYSGTYGTNGFYLNFSDNSNNTATTIGKDYSGNGNNWTPNNISVTSGATYDSMTDVPTLTSATAANFSTLNPLMKFGSNMSWNNGNLQLVKSSSSTQDHTYGTLGVSSGKWYWEMTVTSLSSPGTPYIYFGIARGLNLTTSYDDTAIWYASDGTKSNRPASSFNQAYGASYTTGDVIAVALDLDAGTITFYKNNVSQGVAYSNLGSYPGLYMAYINFDGTSVTSTTEWNFGQRPFTYTPPTGFVALNTFNLPTPTIGATSSSLANKYFDVSLYTGNGTSQSVTNSGSMQPDFVWIKRRSTVGSHLLIDAVRGSNKLLYSNLTDAEDTNANALTSFNSGGFSVGSDANANQNGTTIVGWQWRASNATGVTNTAGSITSTISANTTAGFSIVTYTGTGANATVGHGLGVAPRMVIVKNRNDTNVWVVYHANLTSASFFLQLASTAAQTSNTTVWNATAPTSTVFSIGTNGATNQSSAQTYVAYCFAQVAGYSAFGSYVGNGNADGPFIYTGFRPKYYILKNITNAQSWSVQDTSRSPYNVGSAVLFPNLSSAESTGTDFVDILSNGFKIRHSSSGNNNNNGDTYIYMAFAESPFKYANAR